MYASAIPELKHLNRMAPHETPRSMETGEFLSILRQHLRFPYIGLTVWASRLMEEDAKSKNTEPYGTILLITPEGREVDRAFPIWKGIPYWPQNKDVARWDEDRGQWEASNATPIPGWRNLIESFVKRSIIFPSSRLSFLINRDTFDLARRSARPYR